MRHRCFCLHHHKSMHYALILASAFLLWRANQEWPASSWESGIQITSIRQCHLLCKLPMLLCSTLEVTLAASSHSIFGLLYTFPVPDRESGEWDTRPLQIPASPYVLVCFLGMREDIWATQFHPDSPLLVPVSQDLFSWISTIAGCHLPQLWIGLSRHELCAGMELHCRKAKQWCTIPELRRNQKTDGSISSKLPWHPPSALGASVDKYTV